MDNQQLARKTQRVKKRYEVLHRRIVLDGLPQPRPLRAVVRWLGGFLLGGLFTLTAANLIVEGGDLRFCQPFRHEHMSKVRLFQVEHTRADIVYLGSSQMHFGVMPPVIEEAVTERGEALGTQFNLAVPGSELEVSYILARDVLKDERTPKVIVLGVMPVLVAREEAVPELVCRYGNLSDIARLVQAGELPPETLAAASWRGTEILLQYPFAKLSKPTRPFRWEHLRQSGGGWWLPEDVSKTRPLDALGWDRIYNGYGPPKALYFDDGTRAARVLRDFHDLALQRRCQLLVVYPPQHSRLFTRKYAAGSEERYRAWIADFCRREGICYHDLSAAGGGADDEFQEPFHLNAQGAERFSRRLAELVLREVR